MFVDLDSSHEAELINFFLTENVKCVEANQLVLFPYLVEIHIDLSDKQVLGDDTDAWGRGGNVYLENAKNIVQNVYSCDRLQTHEICNFLESFNFKMLALAVTMEDLTVFEQVRRQHVKIL